MQEIEYKIFNYPISNRQSHLSFKLVTPPLNAITRPGNLVQQQLINRIIL